MRKMKRKKLRAIRSKTLGTAASEQIKREDIWDVVCDTPEEAAEMREKARQMKWLVNRIADLGLSSSDAAQLLGISEEQIQLLQRGRFSRFSLLEIRCMVAAMSAAKGFEDLDRYTSL